MQPYRLYTLDGQERIAGPAEEIECPNDEAAVEQARRRLDQHPIEIWQSARFILRLEPEQGE